MKFYILILIIFFIYSCTPDRFVLNVDTRDQDLVFSLIMSELSDVEKIADNAFSIKDSGIVAMKLDGITQYEFDATCKIRSGEGLNFYIRTTSNYFYSADNIKFTMKNSGTEIRESGKQTQENPDYKMELGEKYRVRIKNDGNYVKIFIDCDEVYCISTKLMATEYIIMEAIGDTKAIISGINFDRITDRFFEDL